MNDCAPSRNAWSILSEHLKFCYRLIKYFMVMTAGQYCMMKFPNKEHRPALITTENGSHVDRKCYQAREQYCLSLCLILQFVETCTTQLRLLVAIDSVFHFRTHPVSKWKYFSKHVENLLSNQLLPNENYFITYLSRINCVLISKWIYMTF